MRTLPSEEEQLTGIVEYKKEMLRVARLKMKRALIDHTQAKFDQACSEPDLVNLCEAYAKFSGNDVYLYIYANCTKVRLAVGNKYSNLSWGDLYKLNGRGSNILSAKVSTLDTSSLKSCFEQDMGVVTSIEELKINPFEKDVTATKEDLFRAKFNLENFHKGIDRFKFGTQKYIIHYSTGFCLYDGLTMPCVGKKSSTFKPHRYTELRRAVTCKKCRKIWRLDCEVDEYYLQGMW